MQIQITGRHVEITEAIKSYVDEKVNKIEHHFDNITDVRVILSIEKENQIAEAIVNVPGMDIIAKAEDKDLYSAIDMLQEKLVRQITKHKNKLKSH